MDDVSSKPSGLYFFYADNQDGDFNIKFTHHLKSDFGTYRAENVIHSPDSLMVINSDKDDLYPYITEDPTRLFFLQQQGK